MKKLISLFIVATLCNITCFAQFYDNDDEIVFYELLDYEEGVHYGGLLWDSYIALNFAGDKAIILTMNGGSITYPFESSAELLNNNYIYETRVFDHKFKVGHMDFDTNPIYLYFNKDKSTSSEIVYVYQTRIPSYPWEKARGIVATICTDYYIFSKDRSKLTYKMNGTTKEFKFKRITKNELLDRIREALVKESNASWRDRTRDNSSLYE